MVENEVVKSITAQVGDIPEDCVRRVLAALDVIKEGAAVGTVVRDAATGAIGCRVSEDGVPFWRVTAMTGNQWIDMQPRLDGWIVIVDPEK